MHYNKFFLRNSHIIGAICGAATAVFLIWNSFYHLKTRCTMALIIPRYDFIRFAVTRYLNTYARVENNFNL